MLAEGLALGFLVSMSVSGVYALQFAGRMRTDALQWPMWIPYLSIPVACAIMDLHWVRRNAERGSRNGLVIKLLIAAAFFVLVYLPIGQYVQLPRWRAACRCWSPCSGPC